MEKQYYNPTLSEFHQNFRYEHYIPIQEAWVKERFYLNSSHINIVKYVDIQTDDTLLKVRVKSLDHNDIIEAGWKESTTSFSKGRQYYSLGSYECFYEDGELFIRPEHAEDGYYLFQGTVKNYNKLLDVMEMLGWETTKQ